MFSSTTLVCIVDLMCIVDHMCLLACNVCGGNTAVAFSCCGILHLTLCGSTSGPCMVSELSCHLWKATIVWTPAYSVVSISVLATSSPCLQHHVIVSTAQKVYPASLLPAQSVTVSSSADRHSLCPHCQGHLPAYP